MDNRDYIYYNVSRDYKDGSEFNPIEFSKTRTFPILNNPELYKFAVERFRIPLINIPIFIWIPDDFKVKMSYDGAEVNETLQFIPNHTGTDIYGDCIWNYQELLDSLNIALEDAYNALKLLKPLMPPTEAPYMTFDKDIELFKWNVEQVYSNTTKVYLNQSLYKLFISFQMIEEQILGERWFNLYAKDNFNNTATIGGKAYYSSFQEFNTLSLWNDLKTIVFESYSIPVNPEFLSGQNNVTKQVLTDFQPLDALNDRQALQYYPQGPYRWYNLLHSKPLSRIDIRVYWLNKQGKEYPLQLGDTDEFSMKLVFKKK